MITYLCILKIQNIPTFLKITGYEIDRSKISENQYFQIGYKMQLYQYIGN